MTWRAYVDESEPGRRSGSGVYLLAAMLIEDQQEDTVRDAARRLLLDGQRKLHWHDESDARRTVLIDAIAQMPALHLITIRTDHSARSERRRRLCLAELLPALQDHGVEQVYLESREAKQNGKDRQMLAALRSQHRIGTRLRMEHQPGPINPLLWIPDLVAGAAGAERAGNHSYMDRIRGRTTILVV